MILQEVTVTINLKNLLAITLKVSTGIKWVISSKFGYYYDDNKKIRDFSTNSVKKQLENSLKSLKTEYIDIYYFHSGNDNELNNDSLWTYLDKKIIKAR